MGREVIHAGTGTGAHGGDTRGTDADVERVVSLPRASSLSSLGGGVLVPQLSRPLEAVPRQVGVYQLPV